jgi:hypothetical protein
MGAGRTKNNGSAFYWAAPVAFIARWPAVVRQAKRASVIFSVSREFREAKQHLLVLLEEAQRFSVYSSVSPSEK